MAITKKQIIGLVVIAAVATTTTLLITLIPPPEIDVRYGGTSIASGSIFDIPTETGESAFYVDRLYTFTFAVANTGGKSLNLPNPGVSISGPGNFTLEMDAPDNLSPNLVGVFILQWYQSGGPAG